MTSIFDENKEQVKEREQQRIEEPVRLAPPPPDPLPPPTTPEPPSLEFDTAQLDVPNEITKSSLPPPINEPLNVVVPPETMGKPMQRATDGRPIVVLPPLREPPGAGLARQTFQQAQQKARELLPNIPPSTTPQQVAGPRYVPPQETHFGSTAPQVDSSSRGGSSRSGGGGTGGNNSSQVASILAQVALLDQRVQELEDDFPEDAKGGAGGGLFNGRAFTPSGILYEDLTDAKKPWIKYSLSTGIITEEVGPPSQPWGNDESWRKKSDLSGAAYF